MTKQKILVIGTGGTIGAKAGSTITADAPLKILNLYTPPAGVDLIGRAAFDRFSEHADLAYLEQLCAYMQGIDYSAYRGVVLLHGSDTLTYTAALLAHLLPDKPLVLVSCADGYTVLMGRHRDALKPYYHFACPELQLSLIHI